MAEEQANGPRDERVCVLTPVSVDGRAVTGMLPRRLVAALALARPHAVSETALVDEIWEDDPPATPLPALQTLVSRVRRLAGRDAVEHGPAGYRLTVTTDLDRARSVCEQTSRPPRGSHSSAADARPSAADARPSGADAAASGTDVGGEASSTATSGADAAADAAGTALAMIGADPGDDLGRTGLADRVRREADRLRSRLRAASGRHLIDSGRSAEAVALLRPEAEAAPWNEDAVLLLMRARHGAGRGGEALTVFADLREALADALGTRPGPEATALNTRILQEQETVTRRIGVRAASDPLIGRDGAISLVEESVRHHRLTSILGVGGLGKTTLAQEVARRSTAPLVAVVELAGTSSGDDVLLTVATTLGIRTGASMKRLSDPLIRTDLHTRMAATLAEQPTLLVLDNCEHLVAAAAHLVGDLLDAVPTLRVLCTSRSPLGLTGEREVPLDPLDTTDAHSPAATLFVERALAVRPQARLDPDEVLRICRRLDGLPLAIELAAARVRTMSLSEIADHLTDRFALLRSSGRSAPERHRTLFAVIDWSWRLLEDDLQRMLRRLALFADGFTAEAAAEVAAPELDAFRVHDALDALAMQSLVTVHEGEQTVRFRMLETVREFCRDRLREAGELDRVDGTLMDWAMAFSLRQGARLFGPTQRDAVAQVRAEQENLIAVLRHAVSLERADVTLAIFGVLAPYWMMRDEHDELLSYGVDVVRVARTQPVPDRVADAAALGLTLAALPLVFMGVSRVGMPALSRARMLWKRGLAQSPQVEAALRMLQVAADLDDLGDLMRVPRQIEELAASEDRSVAVVASLFGSHIAENAGDVEAALRLAHGAHRLATELEDLWFATGAATTLAQLSLQIGDPRGAARWSLRSDEGDVQLRALQDVRQMGLLRTLARIQTGDLIQTDGLAQTGDAIHSAEVAAAGELTPLRDAASAGEPSSAGDSVIPGGGIPHDRPDRNPASRDAAEQPGPRDVEWRSMLHVICAEAAAADGDRVRMLEGFDRAVDAFDTPRARASPWYVFTTAARVCAHALAGSDPAVTERDVRRLRSRLMAGRRLKRVPVDLPAVGAALLAFGAWTGHGAAHDSAALEFFALAERASSRQDFTPLWRDRHEALLREQVGDDALQRARDEAARMPREQIVPRALELLATQPG